MSHRPAPAAVSICPICQLNIPTIEFESHLQRCADADADAEPNPAMAMSPSSPIQVQIQQFQSFLSSQSPQSLSQIAPQLHSLEQQLHSVLVPIATMNGVRTIAVEQKENNKTDSNDAQQSSNTSSAAPPPTSKHTLTSRASIHQAPTTRPGDSVSHHDSPPSPPSNLRPSAIDMSFSPSECNNEHATQIENITKRLARPTLAGASSSSSSSSSSARHPFASSSSQLPDFHLPCDSDPDLSSDEALVRRLQEEEELAASAARRARADAAEKEFAEFMKREGTCSKCAQTYAPAELIQICDGAATHSNTPVCEHRICEPCLRAYLQHIVRRMSNPDLASPSATTFAAAARTKSAASLTEADLMCPFPACTTPLAQWQMKRVLTAADFETLLHHTLRNMIKDTSSGGHGGAKYITCPNSTCGNTFEAMPGVGPSGGVTGTEVGLDGQPMSAAAKAHRSQFRFRCNECAIIFCGSCSTTPYHEGFECAAWQRYQQAKKCRFCSTGLTPSNTARPPGSESIGHRAVSLMGGVVGSLVGFFGASSSHAASSSSSSSVAAQPQTLLDVCNAAECIEKRNQSCDRTLKCGHACGGIRGESHCLVCLKDDCPAHVAAGIDATEDDYCNICYVEGLGQAPTIQLDCGHFFHERCIFNKLTRRWPGSRITFGFLKCPLCSGEISHPSLKDVLAPNLKLKAEVSAKATQRLAFEGLDSDPAFASPQGRYYNRKDDFAMDKFAYYICSKCSHPYFGGQRRCEEAAQQQGEEKFDAEHLVCGGCTAGSDAQNCATHGKDFVEFKCKFCCNIATWYCWGTTHFCTDCHRRQEGGDYVTRMSVSDLPVCGGPGRCPLGVRHPPNGTEFSLGCGICRPRDF